MVEEQIQKAQEAAGENLKTLEDIWLGILNSWPLVMGALFMLLVTWVVAKIVDKFLRRVLRQRRLRRSMKDLLRQIAGVTIWVAGIVIALVPLTGMTASALIGTLGLTSVALGFAFKDIVENFLAGFLILWGFPFDPDDFIRVGETEGKVREITLRNTLVEQTDGVLVIIPNATVFKEKVDVLTETDVRRVTVMCGVAYGESVDESRTVITQAVEACESVRKDRPIQIFAQAFGESSIDFEVTWWTGSRPVEIRRSRDEVVARVKHALDAAGIEIPFPYRTLTFKEPLNVVRNE
jgi:small-conductance mechanosensitive channel